ncbi:MAG TPA: DUF4190 domain-containing protein [Tepidisphaeraceae bacterium]|nr:DUF4190 domain-containing protein [Tepidisphaeraceae bacterium]
MPEAPPPTSVPQETQPPPDDSLSHLFKMSTTSAAGQDYVAINSTAIASILVGVASVLVFLASVFLIVPLAGLVCAIVAMIQIRRSNGTQTGTGFAVAGLVLSLGIGGFKAGQQLLISHEANKDTTAIANIIEQLGADLHSARYEEAYDDFTSSEFKRDIDRKTFAATFEQLQGALYGPIEYARWNGQPVMYEEVGNSGVLDATAMAMIKFKKPSTPDRQLFVFSNRDGAWKIDQCSYFNLKNKKKKAQ